MGNCSIEPIKEARVKRYSLASSHWVVCWSICYCYEYWHASVLTPKINKQITLQLNAANWENECATLCVAYLSMQIRKYQWKVCIIRNSVVQYAVEYLWRAAKSVYGWFHYICMKTNKQRNLDIRETLQLAIVLQHFHSFCTRVRLTYFERINWNRIWKGNKMFVCKFVKWKSER